MSDILPDPQVANSIAARNVIMRAERDGRRRRSRFRRTFSGNQLAVVSVAVVIFFVVFSFVVPLLYHTDQIHTDLNNENLSPSLHHLLGTDSLGYDVLGRLMAGGQSTLEVAFAVAVAATGFGAIWGAVAGFMGGAIDSVMMRIVDGLLAIPPLFVLLFLASIFTPTAPLLILVISFLAWMVPARLIRAEAMSLRNREYVQAGYLVGSGRTRILLRHIVPNAIGTIVVNATFQVADAILLIASLSFLGLGLPPPAASWGGMLTDGINYVFSGYWWEIVPAGACIVATVVAFNFIGDALRAALDARLQLT